MPELDVREQVQAEIAEWLSTRVGGMCWDEAPPEEWHGEADEILALPAVRGLLADRDTLARVAALADAIEGGAFGIPPARSVIVARLRDLIHENQRLRAVEQRPAIDETHIAHQRDWSCATFGPGTRESGVIDHIRKELVEIEHARDHADKLAEWVDVIILALDGAWRTGAEPAEIIAAVKAKQARNEAREWPDWRTADPNKAIEHVRCGCAHDWVHGICRAHGEARFLDGRCGCPKDRALGGGDDA